jgi:hypothetical protein
MLIQDSTAMISPRRPQLSWILALFLASSSCLPVNAQSELDLAKAKEIRDKIHACYKAGKQADAVPLFRQQISIFEKCGDEKALIALLESYGRLLKDLKREPDYRANQEQIAKLKIQQAIKNPVHFNASSLIGKRFDSTVGTYAYLHFTDDENVEIKSDYSRYNGVELEGPIAGTYSVHRSQIPGLDLAEVKVKYTFNGVGRISTYHLQEKNNVWDLCCGQRPLPLSVKCPSR